VAWKPLLQETVDSKELSGLPDRACSGTRVRLERTVDPDRHPAVERFKPISKATRLSIISPGCPLQPTGPVTVRLLFGR
jgi:hypothetical protein